MEVTVRGRVVVVVISRVVIGRLSRTNETTGEDEDGENKCFSFISANSLNWSLKFCDEDQHLLLSAALSPVGHLLTCKRASSVKLWDGFNLDLVHVRTTEEEAELLVQRRPQAHPSIELRLSTKIPNLSFPPNDRSLIDDTSDH